MSDDDDLCCVRITAHTARAMERDFGPGKYPPFTVHIETEAGLATPAFACMTLEGIANLMNTLVPRRGVHIEVHGDEGQGIHDMLAALANDRIRLH